MVGKGEGMDGRLLRQFSLYFPSLYLFLLSRIGLGSREYWQNQERLPWWGPPGYGTAGHRWSPVSPPGEPPTWNRSDARPAPSTLVPSAQVQPLPEQPFCSVPWAAGQPQSFCLLSFIDMDLIPVFTSQNLDVQVKLPKWLSWSPSISVRCRECIPPLLRWGWVVKNVTAHN